MDRAGQFPQSCPARSAAVQVGAFPQKHRRARTREPRSPSASASVKVSGPVAVLLTCYNATETNATVAS